ncbi:MAG: methyltransferase domain-containing protein [Alphaproteobacteria bacterium]
MLTSKAKGAVRALYGRLVAPQQISAFLAQPGPRRLNLGCGHNVLAGWLNVDLEGGRHGKTFMNALRPFPIPDASLDAILCEHLIEHVPAEGGRFLLGEAFRVLKPGGVIRVITPDLVGLARMCVDGPNDAEKGYLDFVAGLHNRPSIAPSDALNYIFYEYGHRHIYTTASLQSAMSAAGFKEITESRAGHPQNPIFNGAEGHPNFMGAENDAIEAFALEATKPAQ